MEQMLFELSGEEMNLDALARLFGEGTATVKKHGERYYLAISSADPSLSDDDALAVAQEELSRMNGIALMVHGKHLPPKIEGISTKDHHTGQWVTHIRLAGRAESRSRGYATLSVKNADGSVTSPPLSKVGENLLRLSSTNEPLARALYLYGAVGYDWRGLYMVLDAIEEGNGGEKELMKKEFAKPYKKKVKTFTHIADNFNKLGLHARHAKKKWAKPKEEMTLTEAQALFRDVLKAWIEEVKKNAGP
jgi:hypothetical protein